MNSFAQKLHQFADKKHKEFVDGLPKIDQYNSFYLYTRAVCQHYAFHEEYEAPIFSFNSVPQFNSFKWSKKEILEGLIELKNDGFYYELYTFYDPSDLKDLIVLW